MGIVTKILQKIEDQRVKNQLCVYASSDNQRQVVASWAELVARQKGGNLFGVYRFSDGEDLKIDMVPNQKTGEPSVSIRHKGQMVFTDAPCEHRDSLEFSRGPWVDTLAKLSVAAAKKSALKL